MAEDTSPMPTPVLTEARVREIIWEELVKDAGPMLTEAQVRGIIREELVKVMEERKRPFGLSSKRK